MKVVIPVVDPTAKVVVAVAAAAVAVAAVVVVAAAAAAVDRGVTVAVAVGVVTRVCAVDRIQYRVKELVKETR